jgi:hypothetical protein
MVENYTFNIKVNIDTNIKDNTESELLQLTDLYKEKVKNVNRSELNALSKALEGKAIKSADLLSDKLAQHLSSVDDQIKKLSSVRAFSPTQLQSTLPKNTVQPVNRELEKSLKKQEELLAYQNKLASRFHSAQQLTEQQRKSLEQQRQKFLEYQRHLESLKTPSQLVTFSGEKIYLRPERTLQQMSAPDIFSKEIAKMFEQLKKAARKDVAKETLKFKGYMDDVYNEMASALTQVGYKSHLKALEDLTQLKALFEKLTTSKDIDQITREVEKSIKNQEIERSISSMRQSIDKASIEFGNELGKEIDNLRRSFENLQRSFIFTFSKPTFFEPAGPTFRDIASQSARRGINAPIGGRYVGDPRVQKR